MKRKTTRLPPDQVRKFDAVIDAMEKTTDSFGTPAMYREDAWKVWKAAVTWERSRIKAIHDRWYEKRRRAQPQSSPHSEEQ